MCRAAELHRPQDHVTFNMLGHCQGKLLIGYPKNSSDTSLAPFCQSQLVLCVCLSPLLWYICVVRWSRWSFLTAAVCSTGSSGHRLDAPGCHT